MKQTMTNLARAAMTLLLAVLTSTVAWADEETFAQPELSLGDLTATSAQIQCSLNGGEAWDLRYRVVAEGEHTMRWSLMMDLTDRSFTLKNLHPDTEYEVQARSVYNDGDDFSDWTPSLKFTTGEDDGIDDLDDDEDICKECAKGDMAEAIYILKGPKGGWYGFAVQIVDAETGTEMAYLRTDEMLDGRTIWLCCGRKYKVNWIHDQQYWQSRGSYAFSLFFEPGDEIYTMHYGEAPENDGLLTQFVMDCGEYCTQRPTNLTAGDVTYNSATLTYNAKTLCEQIAYTTDPDANPDDLRCIEVNKEQAEDETSYTLDNLEPSTTYYIWVRSVCAGEEGGGYSRWTDRIEVTTKSPAEPPSQIEVSAKSARR